MGKAKKNRSASDSDGRSGHTPDDKRTNRRLGSEEFAGNDLEDTTETGMEQRIKDIEERLKNTLTEAVGIRKVEEKLDDLTKTIEDLGGSMKDLIKDVKAMKEELNEQKTLSYEIELLKSQNKQIKSKLRDMENNSRRDNLEISGVKEEKEEIVRDICKKLFRNVLEINREVEIVRCHRIGTDRNGLPRPILLRFRYHEDKEEVLRNRVKLQGTGLYLNDDLCVESKMIRTSLLPVLKELKKIDPRSHFRGEKIVYKGRVFSEANLHDLPVDPHNACTKTTDNVTVFAGKHSRLSNLHPCTLKIGGQPYNSVEHFYQHEKAACAGNHQAATRIRTTEDPYEVMNIGKSIVTSGTDWDIRSEMVMKVALESKFKLPSMRLALQQTGKVIGEGTRNPVWGVGFSMNHPSVCKQKDWTGRNCLGKCLQELKLKLKL